LSFVLLRPDPFALADESAQHDEAPESRVPIGTILRRPIVIAAVAALVGGQATMTLIMTMTPLHLTAHGHGLGTVGFVISGHVAAGAGSTMFGLLGVAIVIGPTVLLLSRRSAIAAAVAA